MKPANTPKRASFLNACLANASKTYFPPGYLAEHADAIPEVRQVLERIYMPEHRFAYLLENGLLSQDAKHFLLHLICERAIVDPEAISKWQRFLAGALGFSTAGVKFIPPRRKTQRFSVFELFPFFSPKISGTLPD